MIAPTNTVSPEWQNENALRAYPLEDDCPAASALPTWLISDLRVTCPSRYVKVFVSSAYLSDTLVSVGISGMTSGGTAVGLLAKTVTRDELEPYRAYSMDRLSGDASGTIAFGRIPAGAQPFRLTFPVRGIPKEIEPNIVEVEYIRATGTQWLDTGWTVDLRYDLQISGKAGFTTNDRGILLSAFASNNNFSLELYDNRRLRVYVGGDIVVMDTHVSLETLFPFTCTYTAADGATTVTANQYTATGTVTADRRVRNDRPMLLAADYRKVFLRGMYGPVKILNPELVRDLVPVCRDGIGYMYDRVTGALLGSQRGVFAAGGPVIAGYEVDAPIVESAIVRADAPGVSRIVDPYHGTEATGIVDLSGNSEFRTYVDPTDPSTIVFELADVYRDIATSVCDATPSRDTCGDTPVKTINGVAPTTVPTLIDGEAHPAGTIILEFT